MSEFLWVSRYVPKLQECEFLVFAIVEMMEQEEEEEEVERKVYSNSNISAFPIRIKGKTETGEQIVSKTQQP